MTPGATRDTALVVRLDEPFDAALSGPDAQDWFVVVVAPQISVLQAAIENRSSTCKLAATLLDLNGLPLGRLILGPASDRLLTGLAATAGSYFLLITRSPYESCGRVSYSVVLTDFMLAPTQPAPPSSPAPAPRPAAAGQPSPTDPVSCYLEVSRYDKLTVLIDRLEHGLAHTHGQHRRRAAARLARVRRGLDRVKQLVDAACRA